MKYFNQKMNHAPFPSIPPIKSQDAQPLKSLHSVAQDKKYKLVFDKRVIDHDTYQSFPHGYKCISTSQM